MPRVLKFTRILTAIATVLMAVLLCWQCIDIYMDGVSAASSGGNVLAEIYRMEDVLQRLGQLVVPATIYAGLITVTAVLHMASPVVDSRHIARRFEKVQVSTSSGEMKHIGSMRIAIFILAVLFILLGVMNGGMYDVLVKAINICTECIGLG